MFANGHEMSRSQSSKSQILQLRRQVDALTAEIEVLESTDHSHLPTHPQPSRRISSQDDRGRVPRNVQNARATTMSRRGSLDAINNTHRVTKPLPHHFSRPQKRHHSVSVPIGPPLDLTLSVPPPLNASRGRFNSDAPYLVQSFYGVEIDSAASNIPYMPSYGTHMFSRTANQYSGLEDFSDPSDYLSQQGLPSLCVTPVSAYNQLMPVASSPWTTNDPLTPRTPSTAPLTYAHTIDQTTTMSRSPSLLYNGMDMLRLESATSFDDNESLSLSLSKDDPFASAHSFAFSGEEQTILLSGAGGVGDSFVVVQHEPDIASAAMVRDDSTGSSSSTSSRSRQRLRLQNQEAESRVIAPRGNLGQLKSLHTSSRGQSHPEDLDDRVGLSKTAPNRRKYDPAYCDKCPGIPSFRGEHELRRHQDREHKPLVKKWIVVQSVKKDRIKPVRPLEDCSACGTSRKEYGAYYNVAAHLRRAHFRPKVPKKHRTEKDLKEKRGGKGGGRWPPMSELKHWMKAVEVEVEVSPKSKKLARPGNDHTELSEDEDEKNPPPFAFDDAQHDHDDVDTLSNDVIFDVCDSSSNMHRAHEPLSHNGFSIQRSLEGPALFSNPSTQKDFSSFPDLSFSFEDSNDMLYSHSFDSSAQL